MEKYFCHPYEICIWEGLLDLIVNSAVLFIVNQIGSTISGIKHPENLNVYLDQFDKIDLFLALFTIFVYGLCNLCIIVTCDIFTPWHVLIIFIISESYQINTSYLKVN